MILPAAVLQYIYILFYWFLTSLKSLILLQLLKMKILKIKTNCHKNNNTYFHIVVIFQTKRY